MKKGKCIDCIHCDIEHHKCYPESKDCRKEYSLTDEDIYGIVKRCDFFKAKEKTVTITS